MEHLLTRRDRLWTYGSMTVGCLVWAAALAALFWAGGCAVGRNEQTGAIVIGVNAGKLVETANQGINAAAGALFGPAGIAVSGPAAEFVAAFAASFDGADDRAALLAKRRR